MKSKIYRLDVNKILQNFIYHEKIESNIKKVSMFKMDILTL